METRSNWLMVSLIVGVLIAATIGFALWLLEARTARGPFTKFVLNSQWTAFRKVRVSIYLASRSDGLQRSGSSLLTRASSQYGSS